MATRCDRADVRTHYTQLQNLIINQYNNNHHFFFFFLKRVFSSMRCHIFDFWIKMHACMPFILLDVVHGLQDILT